MIFSALLFALLSIFNLLIKDHKFASSCENRNVLVIHCSYQCNISISELYRMNDVVYIWDYPNYKSIGLVHRNEMQLTPGSTLSRTQVQYLHTTCIVSHC